MKVQNMTSAKGNTTANQFIIRDGNTRVFQSYNSIIVKIEDGIVYLDERYWDYSNTTRKYRNKFLNSNSGEIKKKIESGEYRLTNLNN